MKQSKEQTRGGGPRTAAGKAIASRNALRHGFAAQLNARSPAPGKAERLARAIAGADPDPVILAQAFEIAEDELVLGDIAMHKVGILERLHESHGDDRDDHDALATALQDLIRLDRYVQQACSRQKRAIRQLMNVKTRAPVSIRRVQFEMRLKLPDGSSATCGHRRSIGR